MKELKTDYTQQEIDDIFTDLKEKGYTYKKLNELTGIRMTTFSDWRSGKHKPGPVSMLAIATLDRLRKELENNE